MAAAIIISSIAMTGIIAALVQKFDEEGPELIKKYIDKENKEE